jgi:hypothetical protein
MNKLRLSSADNSVSLLPRADNGAAKGEVGGGGGGGGAKRDFAFDAVLGPDSTQASAIEVVRCRLNQG